MNKLWLGVLAIVAVGAICGLACADSDILVLIETNHGDIIIELYGEQSPVTVGNFLDYVDSGFYDGLIFHRVIEDFMIQGGGYDPNLVKKSTNDPIVNESDNGLLNLRGTVAMARTADPNSATSQFFINHVDNASLDDDPCTAGGDGYCVFGNVVVGLDVVDDIAAVDTHSVGEKDNVPIEAVLMDSVTRNVPELQVNQPATSSYSAAPGGSVTIGIGITNHGNAEAVNDNDPCEPFHVALYLCTYEEFGADDPNIQDISNFSINTIAGGGTHSHDVNFSAPAEPGIYYIRAEADANDVVTEMNEANNLGQPVSLEVIPQEPELSIDDPCELTIVADPNELLEIEVVLQNTGALEAGSGNDPCDPNQVFWVTLYLAEQEDFSDAEAIADFSLTSLAARSSHSETLSFNAPLLPDTYYLRCVADDANDVVEFDETNNNGATITLEVEIPANITFQKFKIKARPTLNHGKFTISGLLGNNPDPDEMASAETVEIHVGPYWQIIQRSDFTTQGDKPIYVYRGETGFTSVMIDLLHDNFVIKAKDVDLAGFEDPATVSIEFGTYHTWADADEAIINGKKPIPMQFSQGVCDSLRVDKFVYGSNSPISYTKDSMFIRGALATEINGVDLSGKVINFTWGTKEMSVPESRMVRISGRNAFRYNLGKGWGEVKHVMFDFDKSRFVILIRNAVTLGAPPKDFTIKFETDEDVYFEQTVTLSPGN